MKTSKTYRLSFPFGYFDYKSEAELDAAFDELKRVGIAKFQEKYRARMLRLKLSTDEAN